jgi:RNA polymerase sigma factor (sigma-70 family)
MGYVRSGPVMRELSRLFHAGTVAGLSDRELLERFAARRRPEGEVAFAALVARHGPMVLAVCRQILGDAHDADDAFQATFLTLARKAGGIRQPDRLAPWLHGVAVRRSRKLRQQRARRSRHEHCAAALAVAQSPAESRAELREDAAALHEQVARLPDKYRAPIVLCYLQGHTHDTAATVLGWPVGTVRGRLARARDRLRSRLSARGAAPAVLLGGGWPLRAVLPAALADATVRSAFFPVVAGRVTSRLAALLLLAASLAAGGFAAWQPVAEPKPAASARVKLAAPAVADLPASQLPRWVSDAVRNLQPTAAIERAIRESDTVYLVDIRVGGDHLSLRVSGKFAGGLTTIQVRRIPDRSLERGRVLRTKVFRSVRRPPSWHDLES